MIRWLKRVLPRWHTAEREVDEELRSHLQFRTDDLIAQGLDPQAATREAEREFGDLQGARADLLRIDRGHMRQIRWASLAGDLRGDLRFAFRQLIRSPGFCIAAVLTLALAVGGNTAAFTLFRAVLLSRLPYTHPEQLVHLWETNPRSFGGRSEASWPDFHDWRTGATAFAGLEGYDQSNVTVVEPAGGRMVQAGRVTTGFFDLLGVGFPLGRGFLPEENLPGGAEVTVISYGFWQSRFGGSPSVLDSTVGVNGRRYRVVGVLPRDFRFAPVGDAIVWVPVDANDAARTPRFNHSLRVIGRLQPNATIDEARTSLNAVMTRLARDYPETNQGRSGLVVPLAEEFTGSARPVMVALLVAMALVLAIAVANIAGLTLARALARDHEMLVRSSLGASRGRLLRQLLVEGMLLAGLGGMLGLLVAGGATRLASAVLPLDVRVRLALLQPVAFDGIEFIYCCGLTLIAGIGFGLGPMLHLPRSGGLTAPATSRGGTASRGLLRFRDGLIVAQIALAAALLAGAALMGRSLSALLELDPGFRSESVTSLRVALSGPRYESSPSAPQLFFEQLIGEVRALPGVRSAGAVSQMPLQGGGTLTLKAEGEPDLPAAERKEVVSRTVGGEYFQTLGVPLQAGRWFTPQDDSTTSYKLILDAAAARQTFPGGNAVGRKIRFHAFPDRVWEVIGVVGDIRTGPLDQPLRPTIYSYHLQTPGNRMSLVVLSNSEPGALVAAIRARVLALEPEAAVYNAGRLSDQVAQTGPVVLRQLASLTAVSCATLALVLAVVGLYGVVAFTVARRNRELGIRAALGAAPRGLLALVMRHGLGLTLAGSALGLGLSALLARLLGALLFGVSPTDPATYVAVALVLGVVTAVACWLPARQVVRVDPAIALRRE